MTDLIDEVENEIQEEKFLAFVKKYLNIALIISAAAIIFTGFYSYNYYKNIEDQKILSNLYYEAISPQNSKEIQEEKLLKIFNMQNPNYSAYAGFKLAQIYIDKKNISEAIKIFQEITASNEYDLAIQEKANLSLISFKDNVTENDMQILKKLSQKNQVWHYTASLLLAEKLISTNKDEARAILEDLIADKKTPTNILSNANIMLVVNKLKN